MKKPVLIICGLLFVVIVLSLVRIFVSNKIATSGVLLAKVEEQVDTYKLQNATLAEKLYELSSLTNIDVKAERLGYKEQASDFVLNGQLPVALKQ